MNDPALRHTGLYCNQLSSTDLLKTEADGNQVSKKENPSAELADAITLETWRTSHDMVKSRTLEVRRGCGPWLFPSQPWHCGFLKSSLEFCMTTERPTCLLTGR